MLHAVKRLQQCLETRRIDVVHVKIARDDNRALVRAKLFQHNSSEERRSGDIRAGSVDCQQQEVVGAAGGHMTAQMLE